MEHIHSTATVPEQVYPYPAVTETYGIVIDDRLDGALIKLGLDALARRNVDLLVFLCLSPNDIRQRADWPDLLHHIRFANDGEGKYEIRMINSPEELLETSLDMKIIQLPTDTVYSRW